MRYFILLAGSHSEGGKVFEAKSVVPSEHDLATLFGRNRFRECSAKGRPLASDNAEDDDEAPAAPAVKAKAEKKAPDELESSKENSGEKAPPVESSLGEDVTSNFPDVISENDLAVIQKGKKYFVVDRDAPDVAINKKEALSSADATIAFVTKYLAG